MVTWNRRLKEPHTMDGLNEHHLPHEDRSTQFLGVAVTLGLGAVIVLGTLALFA